MVRAAGTVLFGRLEGVPTKAVFVARVRVRSGGEETAWMLAVPAAKEEDRAQPVSMIGGDGEEIPTVEHTKIIALRSLEPWRPNRPKRMRGVRTWKDPESAPRLDALQRLLDAMVRDGTGAPLDPVRPEEFHYSDQTGEQTGAEPESGSESEESRGEARPTASRLVVIPEEEEAEAGLLTAALKALGNPPKRPGKRRSSAEGSVAESRRDAGRSGREEGGAGRKRSGGLDRSPSRSASSEELTSRAGRKDHRRHSTKAKKERAPPSPSDSSPGSSSDSVGRRRDGGSKRNRERDRGRDRDRDRDRDRRRRSPASSDSDSSESRKGRGSRKIATYEKLKRRFDRKPLDRWRYVEKQAAISGYTGSNAVELYVGECTKLGKARSTAILSRIGHEAANGRAELAAGLAAGALGFLDTLYVQGEADLAWRTTLGADPIVVSRSPTMPKSQGIPEGGPRPKAAPQSNVAFAHRMAFSQLIPTEVLEGTLEAGKQWKAWDALTRQL